MRRALQAIAVLVLWGLITHGTYAGSGDEPHYLSIAHSIAFDGDLDLANNYGANEPLIAGGGSQPEAHVRPGVGGIARPVHDIGMPLVFVPIVRIAVPLTNALTRLVPASAMQRARLTSSLLYRHLISLSMIALTAILAGLIFDTLVAIGGSARAAFGTTALLVLSPPLLIFSVLFFTELLSALLCFVIVSRIRLHPVTGPWRWWGLGCLTGFLFLLHARNVGLVIPLTVLALNRLSGPVRRRESAAFLLGLAALVAIRTGINYRFWGTLIQNPHARLAGWPGWSAGFGEAVTRTAGLLVDQEFGLLTYAPVYLLALWGAVALMRSHRDLARAVFLVVGVYALFVISPVTNAHGWTGGWSPAARFLTPVAPLLGLCVFAGLRAAPRALVVPIVALQIAIDVYVWQRPKTLWNDGDGRAAFCEQLGDRPCAYLPSLSVGTAERHP